MCNRYHALPIDLWRLLLLLGCSMAQNLISASLPCSRRLCILEQTLEELGIEAYFCEQVNKQLGRAKQPSMAVLGANQLDLP